MFSIVVIIFTCLSVMCRWTSAGRRAGISEHAALIV